jgi:SdrD B-like domain
MLHKKLQILNAHISDFMDLLKIHSKNSIQKNSKKLLAASIVFAMLSSGLSTLKLLADATTTVPGITIVKLFDGSAPFDLAAGNGNDTGANNGIVRAGQVTAYKFDLSLNDPNAGTPTPYNNFKFISTPLPLGFRWQSLPLLCAGAGSAITGDGITTQSILTCNTGTKNTGDVFSVQAAVFTLPTVVNNTVLSFDATASVSGTANTVTSPAPEVVATVLPKIDVQKSGAQFFGSKNVGGVDGFVYAHGLGIKLKPGSEIPTLPLTFTDDVSAINPNAKFIGCGVSGTQSSVIGGAWVYSLNMPLGKTGQFSAWDNNVNNSVKDSGAITCPTQSGNDQLANISISGVDTMTSTFPSQLFPYNSPVSPGDNWVGSYYTLVWFPATEFNSGNNYNFVGTNKYNDFNPTGAISGAQNFNDFTLEPGRGLTNEDTASQTALTNTEDWYKQIYYRPGPGSFDKADYRFSDGISNATFFGDTTSGSTWGAYVGSSYRSGDGVMGTNGSYTSILLNYYNGVIDIPAGFISCSTIDTSHVSIAPLPGHPTRGAFNFSYGAEEANNGAKIAVEYGIGGAGGAGSAWASTNDMKTSTCDDNDSTGGVWYNDLTTVPGGIDKITKVRFRVTDTWTVAEQLALMSSTGIANVYSYGAVHLKVKPTANAGDVAPNYGKWKDPSGNWFANWINSSYDSTTGLGSYGDRVTIVGTRVRVAKTINDPITESQTGLAGSAKTFYLTSTSDAMGITPAGDSANVKIVDTVPAGLSYTIGTTVCIDALPAIQPTSCQPNVVVNSNGTTTLTWNFGTFTAGSAITKLKYDVTVDTTVADGTPLVNTAVISADNDNSIEAWRTDTATAVVLNPSAFAVQKKILTPLVPIGDQIVYRLIAKNTGATSVNSTDFIDWIPWNGDSRTPASTFDGKMYFTSLTNISGVQASQIRYTKFDRASLSLPNDLDPQTANSSIVWCTVLTGGTCPANTKEVTGFRFETGTMTSGQGTEFELIITPDANESDKTGNIITNRFKGRVDGLTLPIESNNVFATVVGGTIGDTIYWDKSGNGLQDAGEAGIPGVNVKLVDPITGDPIDCDNATTGVQPCSAVTDANGKYKFENLKFGSYKVVVTPPTGYVQSGDPDSAIDNSSVLTIDNSSTAARTNLTGDFGYKGTAKWGDRVWFDQNGDQIQDPSEVTPISGAKITLQFAGYDGVFGTADDITFPQATTDALGNYSITDLPPGVYKSIIDSTSVPAVLTTPAIVNHTITPAEDYKLADYGVKFTGVIGDTIYWDLNSNNIQDSTEKGIAGVTVTLKDSQGNDIDCPNSAAPQTLNFLPFTITAFAASPCTAITDANGKYQFTEIPFGTYNVIVTQPTGFSTQTQDPDATVDNSTLLTINSANPTNLKGDFGYVGSGSFGDKVFYDLNGNGIQDLADTIGVTGAQVTLTEAGLDGIFGNGDDVTIGTKTVDSTGNYLFSNLPAGKYKADIVTSSLSGATLTTPTSVTHTLTTEENYTAGDFGINGVTTISGFNYVDTNNNGIKDSGEASIQGTLVILSGGSLTTPLTTNTLADGSYTFANLVPGTYTVTMSQPTTYLDGKDTASTALTTNGIAAQDDKITNIVLVAGNNSASNNFGELPKATITGSVYLNPDNNGTQDAGEPNPTVANPLPAGTTVTITSTTDPLVTFTVAINPDGTYSQDVPVGTYTVTVNSPAGYTVSTSTELGAGTGANPSTVTVAAGETKSQGKDGLYQAPVSSSSSSSSSSSDVSSSSSSVSSSSDSSSSSSNVSSSIVSSSSSSISSSSTSSSELSSSSNSSVSSSQSSTTNTSSSSLNSSSASVSSSSNVSSSSSSSSSLNSSSSSVSTISATITGSIYFDNDNNGTQDAGEPNPTVANPLPAGTTVTIISITDPLVTFTVAINPDGTYSQDVPVGTYTVTLSVPTPSGYSVTTSTELGNGTGANPTTVTVAAGETKSQGKDGIYKPIVSSSSSSSSVVSSSSSSSNSNPASSSSSSSVSTSQSSTANTSSSSIANSVSSTNSSNSSVVNSTSTTSPSSINTMSLGSSANTSSSSSVSSSSTSSSIVSSSSSSSSSSSPSVATATITGSIYFDKDNNGTQNPSDPNPSNSSPLPVGTTVTITNTTNSAITFTVAINPDGTYSQDVPAGTYTVTLSVPTPSGYSVTTSTELGNGTGANPTTVTVAAGETKSQGKDGIYKPNPNIKVDKTTTGTTNNNDGTYTVGYNINITNTGDTFLQNVYVYDYLNSTFIGKDYVVQNMISNKFALNNQFNGISDLYLTTVPSTITDKSKLPDLNVSDANAATQTTNTLNPGEIVYIKFAIKFSPKGVTGPYINAAGAVGYTPTKIRVEDDPPVEINIQNDRHIAGFTIPNLVSTANSATNSGSNGINVLSLPSIKSSSSSSVSQSSVDKPKEVTTATNEIKTKTSPTKFANIKNDNDESSAKGIVKGKGETTRTGGYSEANGLIQLLVLALISLAGYLKFKSE